MAVVAEDQPVRRMARALTRILQDGVEYLPIGERQMIPVTASTYAELLSAQAIKAEPWEDLEPEPRAGLPVPVSETAGEA